MAESVERRRNIIIEDGRHVLNLSILSVICVGYAYIRSYNMRVDWIANSAFLLGILLGMVALYHGRRRANTHKSSYSAGYIVSFFTVICSLLGLVLNVIIRAIFV